MRKSIVAGVDIGGSHITVALIDLNKREVLKDTWIRLNINSQESAQTILSTWCRAIEDSFKTHNVTVNNIGIAMPGPFDYVNGISLMQNQNKYDALYGLNVKQALAEKLSISAEDIVITNDAECFLKGEVFGGVAKGFRRVIGLTLGTGLGSAIAINEQVEDADLWCSSFKEGIAEDYLSNRWFVKRYSELSGEKVKDVKELAGLINIKPQVQQVFDEFGSNLALFLLPIIGNKDLELVVLGENITQAYPYFSKALESALKLKAAGVEIRTTILGENATLVGAASFCLTKGEELKLAERN